MNGKKAIRLKCLNLIYSKQPQTNTLANKRMVDRPEFIAKRQFH